MKLRVIVDMSNSAFEDSPKEEVARILRELGDTLENHPMLYHEHSLNDINGNEVGFAKIDIS